HDIVLYHVCRVISSAQLRYVYSICYLTFVYILVYVGVISFQMFLLEGDFFVMFCMQFWQVSMASFLIHRGDHIGREIDDLFKVFRDRKSTRLNSSHVSISYAVFCL